LFLLWAWHLHACKAGSLLLEPHLHSILLWLFWRWGLAWANLEPWSSLSQQVWATWASCFLDQGLPLSVPLELLGNHPLPPIPYFPWEDSGLISHLHWQSGFAYQDPPSSSEYSVYNPQADLSSFSHNARFLDNDVLWQTFFPQASLEKIFSGRK
jgi:hypothetical protein